MTLPLLFVAVISQKFTIIVGGFFATILGLTIVLYLWHRPSHLLYLYLLLLPIYLLSMAFLFQLTKSPFIVKTVQPWKELLAFFVLGVLLIRLISGLKIGRLIFLDYLVIFFFLFNLLYIVVPWGPELSVRLYGLRSNIFWVFIYLLGRSLPISISQCYRILWMLTGIGLVAGLVVILEIILFPPDWPNRLGYARYIEFFFNTRPTGSYGLSWTFETATGLRRRSGLFANPLELASSILVTGVATFYLLISFPLRSRARRYLFLVFCLIVASLLLSISRSSTVAFFIEMYIVLIWVKHSQTRYLFVLLAILGGIGLLTTVPALSTLWLETITFQNPSSQGHLHEWLEGLNALAQNPLGLGLGVSGQIGNRFDFRTGGENQYIILAVQLGWLGAAMYIAILLTAIRTAYRAYVQAQEWASKGLFLIAAAAKFGLMIPAFTAHIENYIFVMFVTWWLIGYAAQQVAQPIPLTSGISRHPSPLTFHEGGI